MTEASVPPAPLALPRPKPPPRWPAPSLFGHGEGYEAPVAWMPATPWPLRTNSTNAARRASVAALSPALSRKHPVVLDRKMASYCLRFSVVKTAGSHDVVEVQAPVFLPSSSIVFAASGMDECWKP